MSAPKQVAIQCDACGWGILVDSRYATERMRVHGARCPKRVTPMLKALRDDAEHGRIEKLS